MKKFIKYFVPISCTLVILIVGAYSILKNKQGTTMNTQNLKYGETIQFHKNEILQFPDFSISYIGKTSTKNDFDPNLTTRYHFVVTALDNKNRIIMDNVAELTELENWGAIGPYKELAPYQSYCKPLLKL